MTRPIWIKTEDAIGNEAVACIRFAEGEGPGGVITETVRSIEVIGSREAISAAMHRIAVYLAPSDEGSRRDY